MLRARFVIVCKTEEIVSVQALLSLTFCVSQIETFVSKAPAAAGDNSVLVSARSWSRSPFTPPQGRQTQPISFQR